MYQSPDVIKVKVNVEDVFASYSGCPEDWKQLIDHTEVGCSDYSYAATYTQLLTVTMQCYSVELAPGA